MALTPDSETNDAAKEGTASADTPPWLQPVPEGDDEAEAGYGIYVLAGAAVAVVLVFAAVVLFLYLRDESGPPRRVVAEAGPVRVAPNEPGGLEVPHQDKEVYSVAAGEEPSKSVSIQPSAEKPVDIAEIAEAISREVAQEDAENTAPANAQTTSASSLEQESAAQDTAASTPSQAPTTTQAPAKAASAPENVAEDAFRVQLGAFGSEARASQSWREIRGKHSALFAGLSPEYEAVSTSDRTLFRLRVGPLSTRQAADTLCYKLKAAGQDCIVVAP